MLFEVIVDRWDYRPRRCSMITYRKGQRGFLPVPVVEGAASAGLVRIMEDQPDV